MRARSHKGHRLLRTLHKGEEEGCETQMMWIWIAIWIPVFTASFYLGYRKGYTDERKRLLGDEKYKHLRKLNE